MNKKTVTLLILCFSCCCSAAAKDCYAPDVFEEYAQYNDLVCKTAPISLLVSENTTVSGKFNIECYESYKVEITSPPKKGRLKILKDNKSFEYTPYKNKTGKDSFSYKINASDISSNISVCTVNISDTTKKNSSDTDFYYADMNNDEAGKAAKKLVELDIIKGERVGSSYYFYPDAPVTRAAAISYLNAAAKIDIPDRQDEGLNIFCDCNKLSEQLKREVNAAYTAKIITGKKVNNDLYLCPNEYITKAEFFCMLDRAMSSKTSSETEIKYIDKASIPDYAKICVKNLINANILSNSEKEALTPNNTLTKSEIAVFLTRYIKYDESNIVKTVSRRIKEGFYGKIIT